MSTQIISSSNKGRLITLLGVLTLSPDALLTRLVDADAWTIVWWRTLLTALSLGLLLAVRHRMHLAAHIRKSLRLPGGLVTPFFGAGSLLFVLAITHTTVANTLVILSSGPLFGAFLSWVILKEKVRTETWLASAGVLLGLILVFGDSLSGDRILGDTCALGAALCTTTAFVILRRNDLASPLVLTMVGSLLITVVSTPFATIGSIGGSDIIYLGLLGCVVLPIAFSCIFLGPKYITAPEVGLLMLLETILGPLWVWWVIGEIPSLPVITAGILIIITLCSYWVVIMRKHYNNT